MGWGPPNIADWPRLPLEVEGRRVDREEDGLSGQEELVDRKLQLRREVLRMDDREDVEVRRKLRRRSLDGDDLVGVLPLADDELALGPRLAHHGHAGRT